MKKLLLALWLGGAALYTVDTLVITRPAPSAQTKANISALAGSHLNPSGDLVSSWGPYLPNQPQNQQPQLSESSPEPAPNSNNLGTSDETGR
jgi:hypothetical protein